jgi:hypothetical protein
MLMRCAPALIDCWQLSLTAAAAARVSCSWRLLPLLSYLKPLPDCLTAAAWQTVPMCRPLQLSHHFVMAICWWVQLHHAAALGRQITG